MASLEQLQELVRGLSPEELLAFKTWLAAYTPPPAVPLPFQPFPASSAGEGPLPFHPDPAAASVPVPLPFHGMLPPAAETPTSEADSEWRIMPRNLIPPPHAEGPAYPSDYHAQPAPPPPTAPVDDAGALRLKRVAIHDPAVGNIEGASLLVPEGWMVEGGFVWMPLYSMQANLLLRLTDPQSGASLEILPSQQFCWPMQAVGQFTPGSNWNGSIMLPPPSDGSEYARTFLLPQALSRLQAAQLVESRDLPQLAAEAARGTPGQMNIRCTRLRFRYQDGGRTWDEDIYTTLTYAPSNGWTVMWWSSGYGLRAPAGELDRLTSLLMVPLNSLRITLDWHAMLNQVKGMFQQGIRQEQLDQIRQGQLDQQYRDEMRELHRATWEEAQASQDRRNFAVREILGGIETRTDPHDGRPVELPVGYIRQWVDEHGDILLSHNANFDPRPGSTLSWREMPRYEPGR